MGVYRDGTAIYKVKCVVTITSYLLVSKLWPLSEIRGLLIEGQRLLTARLLVRVQFEKPGLHRFSLAMRLSFPFSEYIIATITVFIDQRKWSVNYD